jgi:hypothetical protein
LTYRNKKGLIYDTGKNSGVHHHWLKLQQRVLRVLATLAIAALWFAIAVLLMGSQTTTSR